MKVALLVSGFLRNYKSSINYIKNEIINKFEQVDVYLHITKDENLKDKYFNQITQEDIDLITNELNPVSILIEYDNLFDIDRLKNRTINHWNKLFKLNNLKKIEEDSKKFKYDLVIRYRFDLSINTDNIFTILDNNNIVIPKESKIDKNKLSNINDNYLSDAFCFGNSYNMDRYFNIYKNIEDLTQKYGNVSETILYNYLVDNDISYKLLDIDYTFTLSKCNVFAICGDSGSGKSTLTNVLKHLFSDSFSLEGDRYHKWERSDSNWKQITHLNPDANYISKMHEDVFNLKIGNHIYQVDYDHNNGKFTEKQLINPSNNLIVCGLHSLYNINSSVYDLKIFMDTQEELTHKWKILRDVEKRGYDPNKVLEQIKKREEDYRQYIIPQKYNADLIIRFFCKDTIDIFDTNTIDKVSLKLSVRNTFNVNKILNEFKINKIDHESNLVDNFVEIIFSEYHNSKLFSDKLIYKNNNFYDYIIYFILCLT